MIGFSRETLIGIIANIEGREFHRRKRVSDQQPLEHPRACSIDDVECFFSSIRDIIGQNFTTKEVKFGMRKIISQFSKHVDPDLPFYYYTSSHSRFYEGNLPDFNKAPQKQQKEKRLPRRELPGAFVPRRATMQVRGSLAVRNFITFHLNYLLHPLDPLFYMNIHMHSHLQIIDFNDSSIKKH